MTREEYDAFKKKEIELSSQRDRFREYERLTSLYESLSSSIDVLTRTKEIRTVETYAPFAHINITDNDFCKKKLIELFENERSIIENKIKEL